MYHKAGGGFQFRSKAGALREESLQSVYEAWVAVHDMREMQKERFEMFQWGSCLSSLVHL